MIFFDSFLSDVKEEFSVTDGSPEMTIAEMPYIETVIDEKAQKALIYSLVGLPNGVITMSAEMENLVETSTNLASIRFIDDTTIEVTTSQRSSRESGKTYIKNSVESLFSLAGAEVTHSEGYPGWTPNPSSKLLLTMKECYAERYGAEPLVRAMHAGLECGLFLESYPHLDMISFGPTMYGVHSPEERLNIASVARFWEMLCRLLNRIGA